MRGRTNVGDGVSLNANTVNKTAKTQITAGDFVEYYTVENLLEEGNRIYFAFNIGAYSIALKSHKISLFKNNVQVDQFTDYDIVEINSLYSYGNYILFVSSSSKYIGVLSIDTSTDKLVLKSAEYISTFYSRADFINCAISASNGVLVACCRQSNSSGMENYIFLSADISANGVISNIVLNQSTYGNSNVRDWIESYNGNFYWIHGSYIYPLIIDSEGKVTEDHSTYAGLSSQAILRKIYQNNDIVVYSTQYNYQGNGSIEVVNLTGRTYQELYLQGICVTDIDDDLFVTYYYYNSTCKLHLYRYNNTTKEVTRIDTLNNVEATTGSFSMTCLDCSLANSSLLRFKECLNNVYKYKYYRIVANSSIQNTVDENNVIAYRNGGNPIGVAKTNGNVNDVIPIYVPTPSA